MKLPEYTLRKTISIRPEGTMDLIEFHAGTLIFPFWNEDNLTSERKQELKDAKQYRMSNQPKLIMCLIGRQWVPVEETNIRSNQ